MQGETEIYRDGALYVADLGRYGYAVEFDHARKVLERLVNVYGEENS